MTEENGNNLEIKKQEHEMERNKWRGRRKMGWVSLWSIIGVTAIVLFAPIPESRLVILSDPITWFYFSMTSVIGAYMGVTAWASKNK